MPGPYILAEAVTIGIFEILIRIMRYEMRGIIAFI